MTSYLKLIARNVAAATTPTLAAAPTAVSSGNFQNSHTLTFGNAAIGQLALLFAADDRSTAGALNTPTGWTLAEEGVATSRRAQLFYRILDGSEDADITNGFTVTTTHKNSENGNVVYSAVLVNGASAPDAAESAVATASATSITSPAVTATNPLVLRWVVATETITPPAGVTEVDEQAHANAASLVASINTDDDDSVGTETFTTSGSGNKAAITIGVTAP